VGGALRNNARLAVRFNGGKPIMRSASGGHHYFFSIEKEKCTFAAL